MIDNDTRAGRAFYNNILRAGRLCSTMAFTRLLMALFLSPRRSMSSVEICLEDDQVQVRMHSPLSSAVESDDDDEDSLQDALSWRLDRRESLSDWTLEVVAGSERKVYHVHKSILAVGPRRMHYFVREFRESRRRPESPKRRNQMETFVLESLGGASPKKAEPTKHITRLELEPLACQAIPVLLDYVYGGVLAIATDNATALQFLAQHLECKTLRREVRDFWMSDLCMENLCVYYKHARQLDDAKIRQHAYEHCAAHIFNCPEDTVVEILTTVDPAFMQCAIEEIDQKDEATTSRLSLLVAVYCNIHKAELTPRILLNLTSVDHLEFLEVKAAKVLLELENEICGNPDEVSSLKERAIDVLAEKWDVAYLDPALDCLELPGLEGEAMKLYTRQALQHAKTRLDATKSDMAYHRRKQKNGEEADLLKTREEMGRLQENYQRLEENLMRRISKLAEEIMEKDRAMHEMRRRLRDDAPTANE